MRELETQMAKYSYINLKKQNLMPEIETEKHNFKINPLIAKNEDYVSIKNLNHENIKDRLKNENNLQSIMDSFDLPKNIDQQEFKQKNIKHLPFDFHQFH